MPDLHPIVKRLDELTCETIPRLQYAVKWKKAYYGSPEQAGTEKLSILKRSWGWFSKSNVIAAMGPSQMPQPHRREI